MKRPFLNTVTPILVLLAHGSAAAENPWVDTQVFRPSPHDGDLFSVRSSEVIGQGRLNVGLIASFGANPLGFVDRSGRLPRHEAIQQQLSIDVLAGLTLFDRLSIGLAVPLFMVNDGQDSGFIPLDPIPGQALGDIRLSTKVSLIQREPDHDGFGLALEVQLGLPTGTKNAFVSDGWTLTPALIADLEIGPVLVAGNLGAHVREPEDLPFGTEVSTELLWRFGLSVEVVPELMDLMVEVFGSSSNYAADNNTYIELLAGGRLAVGDSGLALTLGGGRGLTQGYGSTEYRLIGGLTFAMPKARDTDGDEVIDTLDRCPNDPEDRDGFQDEDGCPDPDNDADGILDTNDRCPGEVEDYDGFQDEDGCPDLDNDADGILDAGEACPNDVEDVDGFEDGDGCPDPDNDKDGILDAEDKCPDLPEDRDGTQDEDGCPDPDNDADGILDIDDNCPDDGTNKCGVSINPCEIIIGETIYFEYDRDIIKAESFAILEAVASVVRSRDWVKLMQVEGHTDSAGDDNYNLTLSQRRAESVMRFIVEKGVESTRLKAQGFGETKPLANNRTAAGRAANRRVQFIILEPSQGDCKKP